MSEKKQGVTWDPSDYFQEFGGTDMRAFEKGLESDIADLLTSLRNLGRLGAETLAEWETVLLGAEDVGCRLGHLSSYLECLTAAHADREDYGLANAALERLRAEYHKIEIEIVLAFKEPADEI